jgi:hypothetical protein
MIVMVAQDGVTALVVLERGLFVLGVRILCCRGVVGIAEKMGWGWNVRIGDQEAAGYLDYIGGSLNSWGI